MIETFEYNQEQAGYVDQTVKRLSDTPFTDRVDRVLRHPEKWLSGVRNQPVTSEQATAFRTGNTKRFTEMAVSSIPAGMAFLATALCGLAVYLEDGHNPLYWQQRNTADGTKMSFCKIRTMKPGADTMFTKKKVFDICTQGIPDPRVTQVGGFLRAADVDEIPQVSQVLVE